MFYKMRGDNLERFPPAERRVVLSVLGSVDCNGGRPRVLNLFTPTLPRSNSSGASIVKLLLLRGTSASEKFLRSPQPAAEAAWVINSRSRRLAREKKFRGLKFCSTCVGAPNKTDQSLWRSSVRHPIGIAPKVTPAATAPVVSGVGSIAISPRHTNGLHSKRKTGSCIFHMVSTTRSSRLLLANSSLSASYLVLL